MTGAGTPPDGVAADEYAARLRALLGPGHAGGLPRRRRDVLILLHAIAARVAAAPAATEREFTDRIRDFLLGPGRSLRIDAATLRRALVDDGFVDRDDHGRDYRASARYERQIRFAAGMPAIERALARGAARPAAPAEG